MSKELFLKLEELNLIREEQAEITEAIGKITGLPNVAIALMSEYKNSVEREKDLWKNISPYFGNIDEAIFAYTKKKIWM